VNTDLLRSSFTAVAPHGDDLVQFFYADLFRQGGTEIIDMFPPTMVVQRDRLLKALVDIVGAVDDLEKLSAYLTDLGHDHRKFGVKPEHYALVGQALLNTLAHFAGEAWTKETAETWAGAYALIAQVMQQGASTDTGHPPWWDATVTDIERVTTDIAILRIRLTQPMNWLPGQSVAVQCEVMPRVWRFYSPANAPRDTRTMDLHVKVVNGGLLSTALALRATPGTRMKLGPPVGVLKYAAASTRKVLMIAGSTGLAPLQAILEQIGSQPYPPDVHLFFGARDPEGLYRLAELQKLAAERDWLTLTHAISGPGWYPDYSGERGNIVDVAAKAGSWTDRDAYICGSSALVEAAAGRLIALGMPGGSIHVEDFGWEGN
jgi:NAD(P)H-flavin reductase/hemoglobin-like flavoprotein